MGILRAMCNSMWPPIAKWGVENTPDLVGKVAIVTGGNSGIGKETVKVLLARNAKVYLAGRSQKRCETAIEELEQETGRRAIFLPLDLADLKAVKTGAMEFQRQEDKLDILINNGGVLLPHHKDITVDGYDQQFGVNVLGHFYLTKLLIPCLVAAEHARVVNLSSVGHVLVKKLDYETFMGGPGCEKMSVLDRYNQSKFANVVVATEFARRYGDRGIVSTSLEPGLVATNLGRNMPPMIKFPMKRLMSYPSDKGALTSLFVATSAEASDANGKYFVPWGRVALPNAKALDPNLGTSLWDWLEEQVRDI